jgi:hypothetical protein
MFLAQHAKPAYADIGDLVRPRSVRVSEVGDNRRGKKALVSSLVREHPAHDWLDPRVVEETIQARPD